MAKVFTPEEREEVKARIVEFVRLSGRETFRQLADKTGVSKTAIRRLTWQLRKAKPDCKLPDKAMSYLERNGLISVEDILR